MLYSKSVKIFVVCLIAGVAVAMATDSSEEDFAESRIFGGLEISISNAPYIVQLRNDEVGHFCGGTLVAKRFVVTAAHCVSDFEKDATKTAQVTVVGGATTITEEGVQRKIVGIFIPEDYMQGTVHNDIAVLKLDADMTGENIEIMELCDQHLKVDDEIQVSGWGILDSNTIESSHRLRTIHIPVVSQEQCAKNYASLRGPQVTDHMFCASLAGRKDSCRKDSGGPAIFNEQLCGVVSWGDVCGDPNHPGVYVDVLKLRSFIEAAMRK